jgi:hypothetical protein
MSAFGPLAKEASCLPNQKGRPMTKVLMAPVAWVGVIVAGAALWEVLRLL